MSAPETIGITHAVRVMLEAPIVPVVDSVDADWLVRAARAAQRGGVRAFEITQRRDGALAAFDKVSATLGDDPRLILGVGSVADADAATALIDAGARFIVTPFLDRDIAVTCADRDVLYVPGVMTPTEAKDAHRLGAPLVKLFPASSVGPTHLRNLLAPMPYLRVMPTGGIPLDEDALIGWAEAGASVVGMGGSLVPSSLHSQADVDALEEQCRWAIRTLLAHRREERGRVA